jgi:hypothetical protein
MQVQHFSIDQYNRNLCQNQQIAVLVVQSRQQNYQLLLSIRRTGPELDESV